MPHRLSPTPRFLLPLIIAVAVVLAAPSRSQPTEAPLKSDAVTRDALNGAIEALDRGEHDTARTILSTLPAENLSPYARSRAEQILFNLSFKEGEHEQARVHIERAIAAGGLEAHEVRQLRYQNAQVLLTEKRWREGREALEEWVATASYVPPSTYYLLAVAHYQAGEPAEALPYARMAVDGMEEPRESWLALLASSYLKQEQFHDAIPVLNRLVTLMPGKKTYLMQLSSVHGRLGDLTSSLAVMQLAYNAGLLTEDRELRRFVELLLHNGMAQRAVQVVRESAAAHAAAFDDTVHARLAASQSDSVDTRARGAPSESERVADLRCQVLRCGAE